MKFWQSKHNPQCKLSQQDLLDISKDIIQAYVPHDTCQQPELVLMPVDPTSLYVYWKLKDNSTDDAIKPVDKQLILKIYSIPEISEFSNNLQLSFEIKVDGFQNQQKVQLPVAATAYSAVIGEINTDEDDRFTALAAANTIHVPRESPVSEHRLNNAENTVKINLMQDSHVSRSRMSEEHLVAENSEHTLQTDSPNEYNSVSGVYAQDTQNEAFIVKNFNDYGYDLKVYPNQLGEEFKNILSKQGINIQLSGNKTKTSNKNTSSQERFSSWL
ncbi:MAG: DUF4912 domain-containing protein [Methyloprofundus sp.]|nr:DUF4912 domain-containing protein [Methyloprofundus sp.]